MTKTELKQKVTATGSYFFSRDSMRFFGDTMANYGTRAAKIKDKDVIELYRKRAVKFGLKDSTFFDAQTFERVFYTGA